GLDRSNESCGPANSTCVSGPGNKHCFSRSSIPKTTDDCRHRPIGLCADAQIEDDGPKMETYHEGTYRCSCVGHADCRPDVRSRPTCPRPAHHSGLTATDDNPPSVSEGPDRAYRH